MKKISTIKKGFIFTSISFAFIAMVVGLVNHNSFNKVTAISLTGSGSEIDPYLLYTKEDVFTFRDIINGENEKTENKNACAILTNDIDLKCNGDNQWHPMYDYNGIFDGNSFTINGIYTDHVSSETGFFIRMGGDSIIKNLGLGGYMKNSYDGHIHVEAGGASNNSIGLYVDQGGVYISGGEVKIHGNTSDNSLSYGINSLAKLEEGNGIYLQQGISSFIATGNTSALAGDIDNDVLGSGFMDTEGTTTPIDIVIISIVIGISALAILIVIYLTIFLSSSTFIKDNGKILRVRRCGKKGELIRLMALPFHFRYREAQYIYKNKEDAQKDKKY